MPRGVSSHLIATQASLDEEGNVATNNTHGTIRVSAHVLVQLGEELVTDVEQAILECVKNAYDADSNGCVITVDTRAEGRLTSTGLASELARFDTAAENVVAVILDANGRPYRPGSRSKSSDEDALVTRHLDWKGRVTIEDRGIGLDESQLESSWLVISGSVKRSTNGKKAKTPSGRTPLGDKGVGRLGSMKLGDILLIESTKSASDPIGSAAFRWADCDVAKTVDEIPVRLARELNKERFKGTRVSVLGLKDIEQWKGNKRALAITKSLARLISPFEAQAKFSVVVDVDGHRQSLVAMTETLLSRAVAQFEYVWKVNPVTEVMELTCRALFRERLFKPTGGTERQRRKSALTFEDGDGGEFLDWLKQSSKMRRFKMKTRHRNGWFLEVVQTFAWNDITSAEVDSSEDPGELKGAWYYFNLLDVGKPDEESEADLDTEAAAGLGIDRHLVKSMAGVSILRDGFRVRSPGDWLSVSSGMTSGSTYGLRFDNTVGYFALTGEHNYRLVEKSDREGFVDNSAFRGFFEIAQTCRTFADDAMEAVRRSQDDYIALKDRAKVDEAPKSTDRSIDLVQKTVDAASRIQAETDSLREALETGLASVARQLKADGFSEDKAARSLVHFKTAIDRTKLVRKNLNTPTHAAAAVQVIRNEIADSKERMLSLYESAAVGLSARGMTHDLRTHIVEIRKRASAIESLTKNGKATSEVTLPHLRAIRASCTSIAASAALIDPLLPRTRAVKESIDLAAFVTEYFEHRSTSLEIEGIEFKLKRHTPPITVRMNRGRLLAVLDNLVRNSVYWLKRGSKLLKIARSKVIRVAITSDGFSLSDTGPGIDPRYEDTIFEMFMSAKPATDKGQGLGLFIVSQLLAADGCSISLAPERNDDGNRFKFVVDLASVVEGGS